MKKTIIIFIAIILGLTLATPILAAEERIHNFEVEIKINLDASINVTEKIWYDFETLERHGIYRDIPVKYKARGGDFKLRIENISVKNEQGVDYTKKISSEGDNLRIKIGDPDVLISGQYTYIINYTVKRAINFFDQQDELYWNAIGEEWGIDIEKSSVKVWLPTKLEASQIQKECFAGPVGSTQKCLTNYFTTNESGQIETAEFKQDNLGKGNGLTVVVGWPKGIVNQPPIWQNILYIIQDNGILLLPILVFFLMFYIWRKKGRDPEGRGTIVPEYTAPDNLTPAEAGTLIDERVDKRDISAEIIHLAVNGYLKITRLPGQGILKKDDYQLEKLKPGDDLPNNFQKYLLESIFEKSENIKISSLKNKFYKDLEEVVKKIYTHLVVKGYFPKNPRQVKATYLSIGGAVILITAAFLSSFFGTLGIVSLVISGLLTIIFGLFMPVKTEKGVLAKEHILGLKMYLSVAEKDRLDFHNAPHKDPVRFEKLLPYAMVLKVEKEWAKQFEGIYTGSPSWYSDPSMNNFSAFYMANALNNFSASANTTLASRPGGGAAGGSSGFGGGGFSGGGFGGGGGGSW